MNRIELREIPLRETLHFLGWRGSVLDSVWMNTIAEANAKALEACEPYVIWRRFSITEEGVFAGSAFCPRGADVRRMLEPCSEAILMAATLGACTERLLLRAQAMDASEALLLDAALSAAIEVVCDDVEARLRDAFATQGCYLTDRFSPGYGDMPMTQTSEICNVLNAAREIGLTISQSGIMIPRKSVCAVIGISETPVNRRPSGCDACSVVNCLLRKDTTFRQKLSI